MDGALTEAPRLAARDLAVSRGGRVVLDVPALEVRRGEVLAVIGPNGAGKSTLLLHLALLERPASGAVWFDGAPTRGHELALRRRMAVVFQEPLLLDRTVRSNLELALALRGVRGPERRERVGRWLARFNLGALAARLTRTLSGGEAQRTSLARAFALEPDVLLLDEPFSALDQPARETIVTDLVAALAETHVTTVFITHDRDEAAQLGDRVAVLIGGRVRQIGPPEQVFGAPVDAEVAAFVGIETVFPARVTGRADGLVTLEAAQQAIEALGDGAYSEALVCIRPEDVTLAPATAEAGRDSARNRLRGRVRRIVRSAAEARVEVDCGVPVLARVTRRSLDDLAIAEGDAVVATFKATAVHLIPR